MAFKVGEGVATISKLVSWAVAYCIACLHQYTIFVTCFHLGSSNSYLDRISSSPSAPLQNYLQLDPKETALVLIEYQNEFLSEGGKLYEPLKECLAHTNMIENSAKLTKVAREKGAAIFHVPIMFREGAPEIYAKFGILSGIKEGGTFQEGTWNAEFHPDMTPSPEDIIVKGKSGLCGFYSTNLDFLLRQRHIKNVVIGGLLTNCCVESTMRTAYEAGYQVYTLTDCTAAIGVDAHDSMYKHNAGMFSTVTNSGEVEKAFD